MSSMARVLAGVILLWPLSGAAVPVTIEFAATVVGVDDHGGVFGGAVQIGEDVTGVLIVDDAPLPGGGRQLTSAPFGIEALVGDDLFSTDLSDTLVTETYALELAALPSTWVDFYEVESESNEPFAGASDVRARFTLQNTYGSEPLSRIEQLPELAGMLNEWQDSVFAINGEPSPFPAQISMDITSLSLVPEPPLVFLAALASVAAARRLRASAAMGRGRGRTSAPRSSAFFVQALGHSVDRSPRSSRHSTPRRRALVLRRAGTTGAA